MQITDILVDKYKKLLYLKKLKSFKKIYNFLHILAKKVSGRHFLTANIQTYTFNANIHIFLFGLSVRKLLAIVTNSSILDVLWGPSNTTATIDAVDLHNVFILLSTLWKMPEFGVFSHWNILPWRNILLFLFFAYSSSFFCRVFLVIFFSMNSCLLQFNIIGQIADTETRREGIVFGSGQGISRYFQGKNQGETCNFEEIQVEIPEKVCVNPVLVDPWY